METVYFLYWPLGDMSKFLWTTEYPCSNVQHVQLLETLLKYNNFTLLHLSGKIRLKI